MNENMKWRLATKEVFENEDWQWLHYRYQYDHVKLDAYHWEVKDGYLKKIGGTGVILFSQIEWLDEEEAASAVEEKEGEFVSKQQYEYAVNKIGELQERLDEANEHIKDLQEDMRMK